MRTLRVETHSDVAVTSPPINPSPNSNGSPPVTEFARLVSELIPGLRQSAGGIEVGAQLDRALAEHAAILHRVELGFAQFLDALLRQFARRDDLDPSARVKLKLIERRLAPYLAATLDSTATSADMSSGAGVPGNSSLELQIASLLWAARMEGRQPVSGASADTMAITAPDQQPAPARPVPVDELSILGTLVRVLGGTAGTCADCIADLEMLRRSAGNDQEPVTELRSFVETATRELIAGHRSLHAQLRGAQTAAKVLERRAKDGRDSAGMAPAAAGREAQLLPGRDALMQRLSVEAARTQRFGGELTIAVLHPDRLDQIDEFVGRMGADEVIRCYARDLLMNFRAYDMIASLNPGLFAVVLPNTGAEQALRALGKLKSRIAATRYRVGGRDLAAPTFSSGLASWRSGETPARLVQRADAALERARLAGPNRIETAQFDAAPRSA